MPSGLQLSVGPRDEAKQHVADVRDRGVGEQALQVALRQRGEVGARHGGDGDEDEERDVDGSQRKQSS